MAERHTSQGGAVFVVGLQDFFSSVHQQWQCSTKGQHAVTERRAHSVLPQLLVVGWQISIAGCLKWNSPSLPFFFPIEHVLTPMYVLWKHFAFSKTLARASTAASMLLYPLPPFSPCIVFTSETEIWTEHLFHTGSDGMKCCGHLHCPLQSAWMFQVSNACELLQRVLFRVIGTGLTTLIGVHLTGITPCVQTQLQ